MHLNESCFPEFWKVSSVVSVVKNVGERLTAKNYSPVSIIFVVSKIFEKLVNNWIVDHLEECDLFHDIQYGLRSCQSVANLLTIVSDRISRAFNGSGATQSVVLDIAGDFGGVWHSGLFHKLKSYGYSVQLCGLIFAFPHEYMASSGSGWKFSLEYPVNTGLSKDPVLHFSHYTLILNFQLMLNITMLYVLLIPR